MAPTLQHCMTMRIYQDKATATPLGPTKGNSCLRIIANLTHGHLRTIGETADDDISAELLPGSCDWVQFDAATGIGHLDARLQFRYQRSGAAFYVSFPGVMRLDDKIQLIVDWSPQAKTTKSLDHYHFFTPIFEVSREEDKWMEQTVFVGHGHFVVPGDGTQAVEFEVYRLVSG